MTGRMRKVPLGILDRDSAEEMLGKSVREMNEYQLATYTQAMFTATFGFPLAMDGKREPATFRRLRRIYGDEAGLLVKWAFLAHRGLRQGSGGIEKFSIAWFSERQKWITDWLYNEVQQELLKATQRRDARGITNSEGWT